MKDGLGRIVKREEMVTAEETNLLIHRMSAFDKSVKKKKKREF